jgi:two-component system response regulator YesN
VVSNALFLEAIMMYKVLIAERDIEYVDQLRGIINRDYRNCQITDIVGSSREVIEILGKENSDIDVAIINVKLTGVNGLEAIKKVRQKNFDTRILVLSEFSYLEFAQEAIRLKVDNYIIIPANDNEISDAIRLCLEEIVRMNHYKQKICSVTTEYQEAKQYIEYSYIYTVLFSKLSSRDIKKYVELLGVSLKGCMVNMELESDDMKLINKQTILQQIYECIHEYDGGIFRFVVGPKINRHIVLYVSYLCEETENNNSKLKELLKTIAKEIKMKFLIDVYIGIGKVEEMINIYASYQDSIRNLLEMKNLLDTSGIQDSESYYGNLYKDLERKYLTSLRLKDGESSNYLNHLLDCIDHFCEEVRKSKIIELLVLTRHTMTGFDWEAYSQDNFTEYLLAVSNIPISELKSWAHQTFEYIQYSQVDQNRLYTKAVSDAINIIDGEYTKNITLEEIAKRVGVSSQYLSKIFKDETNQTFVEYLTTLRINRAKDIIQTSDQPIKQVGIMVGYKDPNYFSRIFRSVVGISPSDFRDSVKYKIDK